MKDSEDSTRTDAPGVLDSFGRRFFWQSDDGLTTVVISTAADVFDSLSNATAYYEGQVAEAQETYATEPRTFGDADGATYWKDDAVERLVIIRKNIVWELFRAEDGYEFGRSKMTFGGGAERVVAKS